MAAPLRYQVVAALGRGGFGTVYRARYVGEGDFRKDVALKVLNPTLSGTDELAARLRDEARMLGLLRHRAIVQVDRLVRIDGAWAVVMEYVDGVPLDVLLARGARPPAGAALEIATEVAAALHLAWSASGPDGAPLRLMHRDIKPGNLQLTAMGEVKVLDFGIASADFAGREARHDGEWAMFTPMYASPERLEGRDGPSGDVYSLGLVLFELLTGEPYGRSPVGATRHAAHQAERIAVLEAALHPAPAGLVALVRDVLAHDPEARPTARELERRCIELRALLHHEPLRFWAERVVPEVRSALPPPSVDAATGSVLVATEGDTLASPPTTRTTGASVTRRATTTGGRPVVSAQTASKALPWGLVSLAGLTVVGLGGALLWLLAQAWDRPPPAPAAPPPTVVAPKPTTPAPKPAAPAAKPTTPAPTAAKPPTAATPSATAATAAPQAKSAAPAARAAPSTTSKTSPAPTPAPTAPAAEPTPTAEPTPAAAPAPAATVSVRVSGDAETVTLARDGRSWTLPATVAPGEYQLRAGFLGRETLNLGAVTIPDTATVRITCSEALLTCSRM